MFVIIIVYFMKFLKSKKGFSLIELAIVIAVIALLIVSVLSSTILISLAKMSSLNKVLVNTKNQVDLFKQTVGVLPGDMNNAYCLTQDKSLFGCESADPTDVANIFTDGTNTSFMTTGYITTSGTDNIGIASKSVKLGLETIASCRQTIQAVRIMNRLGYMSGVPEYSLNSYTANGDSACFKTGAVYPESSEGDKTLMVITILPLATSAVYNNGGISYPGNVLAAAYNGKIAIVSQASIKSNQTTNGNVGAYDPMFASDYDVKYDDGSNVKGKVVSFRASIGTGNTANGAGLCEYKATTKLADYCNIAYVP